MISDVTVLASGGSSSYGVYNSSSSPSMTGITVTVSAGDLSIGVANYSSSSPTMTDITVTASGGATWSFGVDNKNSSSPTMTNVAATASGSGWVFGVHNTNDSSYSSSPTMTNVTATSSGGAAGGTSYGVYNFSCSAVIRRSTMKGATYSIKTDQIPVTISQSTLIGAVSGGVNNKCVACDNGNALPWVQIANSQAS